MNEPKTSPLIFSDIQDISFFRYQMLRIILNGMVIIGTVLFFAASYSMLSRGQIALVGLYAGTYLALLIITFVRKVPYSIKASVLIILLYVLAFSGLFESGLSGDGRIFLLTFIVMTTFLFGLRIGIISGVIGIITIAFFGVSFSQGWIPVPPVATLANTGYPLDWTTGGIVFVLLATILISSLAVSTNGLNRTIQNLRGMASTLSIQQTNLEANVEKRTRELFGKAQQLEIASRVSHQIAMEDNPDTLLTDVIQMIREQFDFYHASVFIVDNQKEFAEIKASTGDAGKQLLARQHRLRFGEGLVGHAVKHGEYRIASNVLIDSVHFKNPLLPDTRSEIAIPLRYKNEVIGALDVQSTQENAFKDDIIQVLEFIADGIASSLNNATRIRELETRLEEIENTSRIYTQRSWQDFIQSSNQELNLIFKDGKIVKNLSIDQDINHVKNVQAPLIIDSKEKNSVIAFPIKIREQTIGVLDLHVNTEKVTDDMVNMVESISNRLSIALENARLVEQLEKRTNQEMMVSAVTDKVRASTEIDNILKATAQEIGKVMGVSEVIIQLDTESI